jgi:hypothetical protein
MVEEAEERLIHDPQHLTAQGEDMITVAVEGEEAILAGMAGQRWEGEDARHHWNGRHLQILAVSIFSSQ